jgi:hypothetical protein
MTSRLSEFTCGHCNMLVSKLSGQLDHDHCPNCNWSRHVAFGYADHPPCGEMMHPGRMTFSAYGVDDLRNRTCEGCDFNYLNPDRYIATAEQYRDLKVAQNQVHWLNHEHSPRGCAIWRKYKGEWRAEVLVEPVYAR